MRRGTANPQGSNPPFELANKKAPCSLRGGFHNKRPKGRGAQRRAGGQGGPPWTGPRSGMRRGTANPQGSNPPFELANKKAPCFFAGGFFIGAPEGIRTPDLVRRRHTLYPAELRALCELSNQSSTPRPWSRHQLGVRPRARRMRLAQLSYGRLTEPCEASTNHPWCPAQLIIPDSRSPGSQARPWAVTSQASCPWRFEGAEGYREGTPPVQLARVRCGSSPRPPRSHSSRCRSGRVRHGGGRAGTRGRWDLGCCW